MGFYSDAIQVSAWEVLVLCLLCPYGTHSSTILLCSSHTLGSLGSSLLKCIGVPGLLSLPCHPQVSLVLRWNLQRNRNGRGEKRRKQMVDCLYSLLQASPSCLSSGQKEIFLALLPATASNIPPGPQVRDGKE